MVIVKRKRYRVVESDEKDVLTVHPRKHKESTIRLSLVNEPTYDAEIVLLPPAKELRSKERFPKESDEIARVIMRVCVCRITNGFTVIQSGHKIEDKQIVGYVGYRELKVQPFRFLYKICTKYYRDGTEKKVVVALHFFRKQTEQLTQQDKEAAKQSFIQWRASEMNTNQYTKIESTDIRNTKEKNEKSLESTLPPVEEMEKIISDMMLKGCYVSDIYERFGVECPDE